MAKMEWEVVLDDRDGLVERLKVEGGWIYRVSGVEGHGLVFVPAVKK